MSMKCDLYRAMLALAAAVGYERRQVRMPPRGLAWSRPKEGDREMYACRKQSIHLRRAHYAYIT